MTRLFSRAAPLTLAALVLAEPALAQEVAEPAADAVGGGTGYILNTLLFLIGGFLVMWMAAGFAMLEAGLVRAKNTSTQCLKNIGLYSIAGLMFWVIGYNIAYPHGEASSALFGIAGGPYGMQGVGEADLETGYSVASDWFFQMVFCATTASIVSGTVAERIKIVPFFIFVTVLTAVIYPVVVSWEWGAGYLDTEWGFSDFAGSTLVHSTGGWAALVGALIIGPRLGRYGPGGQVNVFPGTNIPLATLGTFILWLGWFGFNGASQLAMGTVGDVSDVSKIFVNTNMAAAAGVVVAIIATQLRYKKADVTMALNGALAGLVAITAEPLAPTVGQAILIGGIGGLLPVIFVPILDKLKIDDVVGAIPVHLVAGIWGTMIVPWTGDATFAGQAVGVLLTAVWVSAASAIVWFALKVTIGVRPSEDEEMTGLDIGETGIEAYPEFARAN
ncbi:ammonium transporter [Erythrobacter sp.]|jgi:ammonium transporter, Amt family|uniref:ammonium transporter n=1 Tax=Erythrobacteraceae TaxID=335929 RepID=UPI001B2D5176|nr:ammonium transporter [Erythrobacter sp.]MBO6527209.1 ammonium transporter [Erythrobacter sp.]MBO6531427.1 ammonium transporter [Erythrobacter sp.]MBO6767090.1 ammonium transporter [Erythrobacter sp.]